MKKLFSKEIIIGLTVALACLILFFGIDYLKGINVFKAANYYYATYTDVKGLTKSSPVTVNGFKVGLVRDIEYQYDNPGHVRVELSLNPKLRVPRGTEALLTADLLGTASIVLRMPRHADYHDVGDELRGVEAPGMMDALSGELLPQVAGIMPKVDTLLANVNNVAANPAINQAMDRLATVMLNLETTTMLLNQSLRPVPTITAGAVQTMDHVQQVAENLAQMSKALAVLSQDLKNAPVDSTLNHINQIAANLQTATAQLNSTNSTLGLLLHDPSLYDNLNGAAALVDSLLIDLRCNPKRYIPSIKVF